MYNPPTGGTSTSTGNAVQQTTLVYLQYSYYNTGTRSGPTSPYVEPWGSAVYKYCTCIPVLYLGNINTVLVPNRVRTGYVPVLVPVQVGINNIYKIQVRYKYRTGPYRYCRYRYIRIGISAYINTSILPVRT